MKQLLDNNPLITIIIPIYNSSKYLKRCLDSVINQSYLHFECFLLNDGSKDESGTICDMYAAKDKRFVVFHKPNEGPSITRNFGLEKAKGEWIAIIDSDDYIDQDYILEYLKAPIETELVIQSISDYLKDDPNIDFHIEYHSQISYIKIKK